MGKATMWTIPLMWLRRTTVVLALLTPAKKKQVKRLESFIFHQLNYAVYHNAY